MSDDRSIFQEITHKPYADQAKWFLNGFWDEGLQQDADKVWNFTHKFIELDSANKKNGHKLDEFWSHKFLEDIKETSTVVALRTKLKEANMQVNGNHMSLLEYLSFRYNKDLKHVAHAPQGSGDPRELQEAQNKLEAVQLALEQQQKAEAALRQAEVDQRSAVADLHRQEEDYKNLVDSLEKKIKDSSSQVQRSKASAELAQVKGEDPLPLRKAKITSEAALRRVEKERKEAEEKTRETEKRFQEAIDYLEAVKKKGSVANGSIWWMEKELAEAKKYLPKSKQ
eukprot:TRINITY_DN1269_c0_g1_i1.p1 TRINITY_DN1269_c0_g1~~TRINITY_DN1269_c0_g1_i1.p1  ORF type:complete len:283 (-),score=119.15 TRINITY_DN1269_c0_g1_i1:156-1004(-)